MTWLFLLGVFVILGFGLVVFVGAPYVPTLRKQVDEAFDLLDLKPGQTLVELGSGDGRLLRAAAERGVYAIGYELNPILVIYSMWRHVKYRRYITVHWGSYWRETLPVTDGIYVFLLQKYMSKLDTKIEHDKQKWSISKPVKLVSFAFEIPNKKPAAERNGLRLYTYK